MMSVQTLAEELGISKHYITEIVKRFGLKHSEKFHRRGIENLSGKRFGRLTVLKISGNDKSGGLRYSCICDCGNLHVANARNLRKGEVRSCGCLVGESRFSKHNGSYDRLYHIWIGIKSRCFSPNTCNYRHYGGRGITMCEEWRTDYTIFRDWALAHGYDDNLTIERVNNNGNYCPENCIWTSQFRQNNNSRFNHMIEFNGKIQSMADWARELGISYPAMRYRVDHGQFPPK